MAFISLFGVLVLLPLAVVIGTISIIAGTVLIRKTRYKKTGIAIRIFGYIVLAPVIAISIALIVLKVTT